MPNRPTHNHLVLLQQIPIIEFNYCHNMDVLTLTTR
jgi:hypothetical protein